MKIKTDLIVFDLDGTLADTLADLTAAANFVCRQLGLPEHSPREIQQMIGGGEKTFILRVLGEGNQDRFDRALKLYLDYYSRHCGDQTRLYPGVRETLASLYGKKLAVLSNKMERLSRLILEALGIASFFAAIRGGDSYDALKPSPQGLESLIQELGVPPARTLMVGDKPADVLAGRGAGAHTLAVTYGYGEPGALRAAGPEAIIEDFPRIKDFID